MVKRLGGRNRQILVQKLGETGWLGIWVALDWQEGTKVLKEGWGLDSLLVFMVVHLVRSLA